MAATALTTTTIEVSLVLFSCLFILLDSNLHIFYSLQPQEGCFGFGGSIAVTVTTTQQHMAR